MLRVMLGSAILGVIVMSWQDGMGVDPTTDRVDELV